MHTTVAAHVASHSTCSDQWHTWIHIYHHAICYIIIVYKCTLACIAPDFMTMLNICSK